MPPYISAAAASASTSSQSAITFANNMRIASIGIAAYEYVSSSFLLTSHCDLISASYLITIPAEFRLYKTSSRRR